MKKLSEKYNKKRFAYVTSFVLDFSLFCRTESILESKGKFIYTCKIACI